jgi:hypothetical protein
MSQCTPRTTIILKRGKRNIREMAEQKRQQRVVLVLFLLTDVSLVEV